jgi:ABC-type bacteriocin/lantibiotic exporter with double-glycine peptidase domain
MPAPATAAFFWRKAQVDIGLKNITFRYQEARNPVFSQLSARLSLKGFNAFFGLSGS